MSRSTTKARRRSTGGRATSSRRGTATRHRFLVPAISSSRSNAAGVPWAIATSSRRAQVRTSIDALKLPSEPTVIDGSHVSRAKPAPDLLLLAAQELGVDPRGAWCVGDSTFDMLAARAAGMHPIGVTSGAVAAAALFSAGAAEVIDSLTALIPRVQPPG